MIKLVLTLLLCAISIFGGVMSIGGAIHAFLKKQYYWFGFDIMLSIYFIVYLAKHILGGL